MEKENGRLKMARLNAEISQALAIVADFIYKNRYHTDWDFVNSLSGLGIDLSEHPRLIRSQSFSDPDYPSCVLKYLSDVYERSSNAAEMIIAHIIEAGDVKDAADPRYRYALERLGLVTPTEVETSHPALPVLTIQYLSIKTYPDDFYAQLVEQINRCYSYGLFLPAQILIRKLLENALIDILRKRYGFREINLFYDTKRRRFLDFSHLLEIIKERISDFEFVKDSFNEKLLDLMNKYREVGNSRAHNINVEVDKREMDTTRDKLNFIVKSLFRAVGILSVGR